MQSIQNNKYTNLNKNSASEALYFRLRARLLDILQTHVIISMPSYLLYYTIHASACLLSRNAMTRFSFIEHHRLVTWRLCVGISLGYREVPGCLQNNGLLSTTTMVLFVVLNKNAVLLFFTLTNWQKSHNTVDSDYSKTTNRKDARCPFE